MSDTEDHADASDCSNGQSPPKRPQRFRDRSKVKYQPIFFVSFFMPHELVFAFYDVGFIFFFVSAKEMLSKQAVHTKQMLSKQAVKIAKQAEEHERFINKVLLRFPISLFVSKCFLLQKLFSGC